MNNINFKANIKPINTQEFEKLTQKIGNSNSINYPWTYKESLSSNEMFTKRICDCTGCLISNSKQSLMMHLRPDYTKNLENSNIINLLKNNLDLKNNFSAILIGSKNTNKSLNLFNKIKEVLTKLEIPFSEIRNCKTPTSIAYNRNSDTFFITNATISKFLNSGLSGKESIDKSFEEIKISPFDKII